MDELRCAIPDGFLTLDHQPQLDLARREIRGVEALVRWEHPELGLLEPGEFLLVAEAADLADSLTSAVLAEALGQLAQWQRDGRELSVAVNLALPNVGHERLPIEVSRLLAEPACRRAAADALELTERAVGQDPRRALAMNDPQTAGTRRRPLTRRLRHRRLVAGAAAAVAARRGQGRPLVRPAP